MKLLINYSILLIFIYYLKFLPSCSSTPTESYQSIINLPLATTNTSIIINETSLRSRNETNSNLTEKIIFIEKPKKKNDKKNKDKEKDKDKKKEDESKKPLSQRIKENKGKIIMGSLLCFLALIITLINEFQQLRKSRLYEDAYKECKEVSIEEIEKDFEGKLIIASGPIITNEKIIDHDTGISVEKSLKLIRIVEMNQWKEVEIDGKTVYHQIWSSTKINSDNFKNKNYKNPETMQWLLEEKNLYSENTNLGVFRILPYHIDQMKNKELVFISEGYSSSIEGNLQFILEKNEQQNYFLKIKTNFIYVKTSSNNLDSIGDFRIKYLRIPSKDYSIIAGQYKNTLVPYNVSGSIIKNVDAKVIENINRNTTIFWIQDEKYIKQDIFRFHDTRNTTSEWFFRLLAIGLCFLGIYLILIPFAYSLRSLNLLSSFGKFAHIFFTFVLASLSILFVIGSFWLFRKPAKGFFMLLLMIPFIVILIIIFKKPGLPEKESKDKDKDKKKKGKGKGKKKFL